MAGPTALRSRSISNASQKNGSNHANTIIGCPCQECKRCAAALKAVMSWSSDARAESHFQAFMGEMRLGWAKQVHVPKIVPLIERADAAPIRGQPFSRPRLLDTTVSRHDFGALENVSQIGVVS